MLSHPTTHPCIVHHIQFPNSVIQYNMFFLQVPPVQQQQGATIIVQQPVAIQFGEAPVTLPDGVSDMSKHTIIIPGKLWI